MNNYKKQFGPGKKKKNFMQVGNKPMKRNTICIIWDIKVQDQNQFKKGQYG